MLVMWYIYCIFGRNHPEINCYLRSSFRRWSTCDGKVIVGLPTGKIPVFFLKYRALIFICEFIACKRDYKLTPVTIDI